MKKEFDIVILPTEKATVEGLKLVNNKYLQLGKLSEPDKNSWENQHIYILSDEKIEANDWFYNPSTNEILYASHEILSWNSNVVKQWKKVIATTDKLTSSLKQNVTGGFYNPRVPQIPESFKSIYVKAYNADKPITKVNLEEEETTDYTKMGRDLKIYRTFGIKTNVDNTVIIHSIEPNTYTREEVEELFEKYIDDGKPLLYPWIKDNLK